MKYKYMNPSSPYLSSLWDFPWRRLLLIWLVFFSCFIYVPLPCNHGFDWLFDWPTIDLFVLPEGKSKWLEAGTDEAQEDSMHSVTVSLPSPRRFCMAWAWDEFLHFHPTLRHMTSYSGSETYTDIQVLFVLIMGFLLTCSMSMLSST